MRKLSFIKVLFSPLKPFGLKFYLGKTKIGVPYFFPRKWVDNPDEHGRKKSILKKIGFDSCGLGWKTKWTDTDYRFEWSPVFSFVFFGYQFAITVSTENPDQYWEIWLYYDNNTDKDKTKKERIEQCMKEFPQTYRTYVNGYEEIINYYDVVLREKYK